MKGFPTSLVILLPAQAITRLLLLLLLLLLLILLLLLLQPDNIRGPTDMQRCEFEVEAGVMCLKGCLVCLSSALATLHNALNFEDNVPQRVSLCMCLHILSAMLLYAVN